MVNSLWFKWRSLRLPWRKSFMVGQDLAGNTFWEFKDVANANRFRRIVKFDPKTHYGDVQVTPQWHQWLRYLREHPPSLEEQRQDLIRQAQMKQLAQLADERWASKPSVLDKPKTQQPAPATQASETTANPTSASQEAPASQSQPTPNPWAQADRRNPGDGYQPDSWTPTSQR
ncbi:NADH:ubiquinone oxidoreductase 17.2kDa subunit [Penicillium capsulatum]|uniref:NADH:ubiquinone oxidoreductase 17.2kDa subunit n=1 Tax=Penicillium capsulatum TaxID=69766 RepID=A0A9W9IA13_9EURO|nr:NADH:ubiquinone oxidoreductase 17.2kDa subunit [Penicillium capsulatum]KAJ6135351.1 NADH:ubiquinone oxidoreductase 17.2kDa subunit [Penicillium capsulatum]